MNKIPSFEEFSKIRNGYPSEDFVRCMDDQRRRIGGS